MIIELQPAQLKCINYLKDLIDFGAPDLAEAQADWMLDEAQPTDKEKLRLCFEQLGLYV